MKDRSSTTPFVNPGRRPGARSRLTESRRPLPRESASSTFSSGRCESAGSRMKSPGPIGKRADAASRAALVAASSKRLSRSRYSISLASSGADRGAPASARRWARTAAPYRPRPALARASPARERGVRVEHSCLLVERQGVPEAAASGERLSLHELVGGAQLGVRLARPSGRGAGEAPFEPVERGERPAQLRLRRRPHVGILHIEQEEGPLRLELAEQPERGRVVRAASRGLAELGRGLGVERALVGREQEREVQLREAVSAGTRPIQDREGERSRRRQPVAHRSLAAAEANGGEDEQRAEVVRGPRLSRVEPRGQGPIQHGVEPLVPERVPRLGEGECGAPVGEEPLELRALPTVEELAHRRPQCLAHGSEVAQDRASLNGRRGAATRAERGHVAKPGSRRPRQRRRRGLRGSGNGLSRRSNRCRERKGDQDGGTDGE